MNPKISVLIPAFNEAKYITATLQSLKEQTFRDFEVIVADNNSTDNTADIARSFEGVKVVEEAKKGVCAARQAAFLASRGQIVVTTDADTTFYKDWLEDINKTFENEGIVGTAGKPHFYKAPFWGKVWAGCVYGTVSLIFKLTGVVIHVSAANLAFRKEAFSGYNTDLTQGGDELYVLREIQQHGKVVYSNKDVITSSRRLKKGLLYNTFVTMLGYYFGDYLLSHITKKSSLGSYPAIRDEKSQEPHLVWRLATVALALWFVVFALNSPPLRSHDAAIRRHIHGPNPYYIQHVIPADFSHRDII